MRLWLRDVVGRSWRGGVGVVGQAAATIRVKEARKRPQAPTRADCSDAELGLGESSFGDPVISRWTAESAARQLHRVVAGWVGEGDEVLLKHRVEAPRGLEQGGREEEDPQFDAMPHQRTSNPCRPPLRPTFPQLLSLSLLCVPCAQLWLIAWLLRPTPAAGFITPPCAKLAQNFHLNLLNSKTSVGRPLIAI